MFQDSLMTRRHDHIMANTWRLIFERQSTPAGIKTQIEQLANDSIFEELLTEYRLIGLTLANPNHPRRYS